MLIQTKNTFYERYTLFWSCSSTTLCVVRVLAKKPVYYTLCREDGKEEVLISKEKEKVHRQTHEVQVCMYVVLL